MAYLIIISFVVVAVLAYVDFLKVNNRYDNYPVEVYYSEAVTINKEVKSLDLLDIISAPIAKLASQIGQKSKQIVLSIHNEVRTIDSLIQAKIQRVIKQTKLSFYLFLIQKTQFN